ncbi:MAG: hypothetical protein ACOYOJ_04730 [Alsobacter sp.]
MSGAPSGTGKILRAGQASGAVVRPLLAVLLAYALAVAALVGPGGRLAAMPGWAPEWCRGDSAGEPASGTPADHPDCATACARHQPPSPPPAAAGWTDPAPAWQTAVLRVGDGEGAPAFPPAAPQSMRGPPTD